MRLGVQVPDWHPNCMRWWWGGQYDTSLGAPQSLGIVIMGVFIASFAGTTLDTSTRLQRYMITELGNSLNIRFSTISATLLAVVTGALLAFSSGASGKAFNYGHSLGRLINCFVSIGLGLITLHFKDTPRFVMVSAIPFLFMLVMTLWATIHNHWQFFQQQQWLLLSINSWYYLLRRAFALVWSSGTNKERWTK